VTLATWCRCCPFGPFFEERHLPFFDHSFFVNYPSMVVFFLRRSREMNKPRKRLELEALEARETPSASPMTLSGFDPTSLQGMVGQLSAQLGSALNTELQTTLAFLNNANAALAAFQQAAVSATLSPMSLSFLFNPASLLLNGMSDSSTGMNPHT
jgi:hypothetical protein